MEKRKRKGVLPFIILFFISIEIVKPVVAKEIENQTKNIFFSFRTKPKILCNSSFFS